MFHIRELVSRILCGYSLYFYLQGGDIIGVLFNSFEQESLIYSIYS